MSSENREGTRVPVRRALISVYDKEGIVDFARGLADAGVEILSTGGTGRLLRDAGIEIRRIAEVTGFPEMLDGRVKTLHPLIHAGILAVRGNPRHLEDVERSGAPLIDLVVVNLYPFEQTARMENIGLQEIVEMIDIGGPTMVRAAAKNFDSVGVVVDPRDYGPVLGEVLEHGGLDGPRRMELACKAFRHTAAYDAAIFAYLSQLGPDGTMRPAESPFPQKLALEFQKVQELRYGENPHQRAAFYGELHGNQPTLAGAVKLQGKELSFNNLLDLDAALGAVLSIDGCGAVVVKHLNPCGAARGENPADAFRRAREGDPVSAFGGIVAFNAPVDEAAAVELTSMFLEAVIAPDFTPAAREVLARKRKLRVMQLGGGAEAARGGFDLRRVWGGILVQDWDTDDTLDELTVPTRRKPTDDELRDLRFGWKLCRHVKSNAIVFARDEMLVGVGAGQMSRVDSVRLAASKAGERSRGAVMASDAFFPFRDGLDAAAEAGVTAVIQPGGSIRDEEVIAAADEHGVAMVFTGRRHFKH
ncbi:MAG: bifunctional phosphoribosylaminoimidazolecarboxamide formyltransferase/IMP cyclohydrolase PurH [Acidobacteria bacterium]|nr:MAG: bifunctional phosphoribosylaminoimidazolecarboxamide formyltransferase/IMP cyclohydrolase PurH [Acidobacteriota bacterium]